MKKFATFLFTALFASVAFAGDAPRGFMELDELAEAQAKAEKSGKLVAIVAKGKDDACPRCAAALENGTKAIKSNCVMVFARVADVRSNDKLPKTVTNETRDAPGGASVTFYVFDSKLEKLQAEANRGVLESDKKATKAFKAKVKAARKALKS